MSLFVIPTGNFRKETSRVGKAFYSVDGNGHITYFDRNGKAYRNISPRRFTSAWKAGYRHIF